MGAGFGAIGSAGGYLNHRAQNSETGRVLREQGRMEMMIDAALAKGDRRAPSYQLAAELQRELAAGKADDAKLGQLVYAIIEEGANGWDAETTPAAQNAESGIMLPRAGERGMLPGNETAAPGTGTADTSVIEEYQRKEYHSETLDTARAHLSELERMQPVANLTGHEFQKTDGDSRSLRAKVIDFFDSIGNKVFRAGMGEIELNRAGAHDSLEHGYGKLKAATFAALPDVLRKGALIESREPYAGHDYNSYYIAAPVKVGKDTCYVCALVIKDRMQRYKLHEVLTAKDNGAPLFQSEAVVSAGPLRNDAPSGGHLDRPVNDTIQQTAEFVNRRNGANGIMLPMAGESRLARTARALGVQQNVTERLRRVCGLLGVSEDQVELYHGKDAGDNGYRDTETGRIYLNVNGRDPVAAVLGHEVTHALEGSQEYGRFARLILNEVELREGLDGKRQELRERYAKHGVTLDGNGGTAQTDAEIVAEYVQKRLLTDEAAIRSVVERDQSFGHRMIQWLDRLLARLGSRTARERVQEREFLTNAREL